MSGWRKRTIMEMAREVKMPYDFVTGEPINLEKLEAFAELVRADEREACAKVCETNVWSRDVGWWQSATKSDVSVEASLQCAAAIRARSKDEK